MNRPLCSLILHFAHGRPDEALCLPYFQGAQLVDGYAPFCKHIFVQNFVGAKLPTLEITNENRYLLQCGYSRRRPEELPVLTR